MKGSPKTKTPTQTAVTGSVAPSTEVRVEPIWCTACTNVMLDTTVGKKANKTRLIKEGRSGMGWIPVPACKTFLILFGTMEHLPNRVCVDNKPEKMVCIYL